MPTSEPQRLLSDGAPPPAASLEEARRASSARDTHLLGARSRARSNFTAFTARGPKLTRLARFYAAGRAFQRFIDERRVDSAATLSFYFVLAVVPAGGAIISTFSLFGQGDATVTNVLTWLSAISGNHDVLGLQKPFGTLARSHADIAIFILGILLSLWSAGKFVSAFGTYVNQTYGISEGRGFFRRRGQGFLLTLILTPLLVIALTLIIANGGFLTRAGFSSHVVLAWQILRFPAAALVMFTIIGILYAASSNVRQAHIVPVTNGALVAMGLWLVISVALLVSVIEFRLFATAYGSLAGIVVIQVWLWLSCCSLVYGAMFDAELTRAKQLAAGIPAETTIWVSPRALKRQLNHNQRESTFTRMGTSLRASSGASVGKVGVRDFWAR